MSAGRGLDRSFWVTTSLLPHCDQTLRCDQYFKICFGRINADSFLRSSILRYFSLSEVRFLDSARFVAVFSVLILFHDSTSHLQVSVAIFCQFSFRCSFKVSKGWISK